MTDPNLPGVIEFMDDMIKWAEEQRNKAQRDQVVNLKDYGTRSPSYDADKHFYRGVLQGFKLSKENLQEAIRRTIDIRMIFPDLEDLAAKRKEAADD
jgi:hypothetical protein